MWPACAWFKNLIHTNQFIKFLMFILVIILLLEFHLVLGNISIFWKYRNISFDNISYRGNFSISKYRISILIVFIVFMYTTHEVYIAWI